MWFDVKILKQKLSFILLTKEAVVCDNEYTHTRYIIKNRVPDLDELLQRRSKACHKTCSATIKHYNIGGQTFRHSATLQSRAFHSVSRLVALSLLHYLSFF